MSDSVALFESVRGAEVTKLILCPTVNKMITKSIIVPTLRVGMRPKTLQRLHFNLYFIGDALPMKTLERELRHSNAEHWNDTIHLCKGE